MPTCLTAYYRVTTISIRSRDGFGGIRCPSGSGPRPLGLYNTYFGKPRFTGKTFYGGHLDPNNTTNSNEDNYTLFESNGIKFISINLAYRPAPNPTPPNLSVNLLRDNPELNWANTLLEDHDDRLAIVTSHYFLNTNEAGTPPMGQYGQAVYDALKANDNLFMMLSGHWWGEAWVTETTDRDSSRPVQALMANYQGHEFPDDGDSNTPVNTPNPALIDFSNLPAQRAGLGRLDAGFMRIMRFDTDTRMVAIETFIPPVVPIKNRTGTLVSTYTATSGADMNEKTASNLSFSFDDYVPLPTPPFVLTGSRANDTFVRFLANRVIPASEINRRCNDAEGCQITLTRTYGTTAPVVYGPIGFRYNPATSQFQVLNTAGNVVRTGTNANSTTEAILGPAANTNCWFSDWDSSGTGSNGDRNQNWSVLILNNTGTNLTCTINIAD